MSTPFNARCQTNVLLSEHCTFGIGGPAKFFCKVKTVAEMQALVAEAVNTSTPYMILGKGSNTLFDDRGFNGLVIANGIDFLENPEEDVWHVGGGYSFSLLGTQTARQGWSGLEFASGIPGTVGGAVYMNAGANGSETSEKLISVDFINEFGEFSCYTRDVLEFGNRFSSFQSMRGAIVGATFRLIRFEGARKRQLELFEYRKRTQPYNAKSAGCVFKNPYPASAGALIDRLGLKGLKIGGAEVSALHGNFIINEASAKAEDVFQLIQKIKQKVKAEMQIDLEMEIRFISYQETPKL